jgi:hypothetical protein
VSGKLELKTPVVVIAPPQMRAKFCPSLPEKKTMLRREVWSPYRFKEIWMRGCKLSYT